LAISVDGALSRAAAPALGPSVGASSGTTAVDAAMSEAKKLPVLPTAEPSVMGDGPALGLPETPRIEGREVALPPLPGAVRATPAPARLGGDEATTAQDPASPSHAKRTLHKKRAWVDRTSTKMLVLFLIGILAFGVGAAIAAAVVLGTLDVKLGILKDLVKTAKELWLTYGPHK
jgi:hypothetical protein